MASEQTHAEIDKQIRSEKAHALQRAFEALEATVAELERAATTGRRAELVAEAGERLWFLVIQREAMGLTRHDVVYEMLRIPGEVRYAMGPRRR
jgi:phosphoribosyl-ATP pyrophosphohydrolase